MSGEMTVRDAGRRGGLAVAAKYDAAHFARIARLAPPRPRSWYQAIGRKGGLALRDQRGREHDATIGERGGQATLARHGRDHDRQVALKRHQEAAG